MTFDCSTIKPLSHWDLFLHLKIKHAMQGDSEVPSCLNFVDLAHVPVSSCNSKCARTRE